MSLVDKKKAVSLKGQGNGLRLIIGSSDSQNKVITEATELLKTASSLIKDTRVTIDTGERVIDGSFILTLLKKIIWPFSLNVMMWRSDDIESVELLQSSGFVCHEKGLPVVRSAQAGKSSTMIVDKSLRSGQKIENDGDIVVFGHVHDGSEVVSGGNVFIFGRLRGLVHAGSYGNDNCFITTDSFMARQVRIGKKVSNELEPELQQWWECPVIISTDGDKLNVRKRN